MKREIYTKLYAAGECACVSVHDANRLGTNSLLDLIVFGRRAGKDMARFVKEADPLPVPKDADAEAKKRIARLLKGGKGPSCGDIREEMEVTMMEKVGIYRNAADLAKAVEKLMELRRQYRDVRAQDRRKGFNTDLIDRLELQNLLDLSLITAPASRNRKESRGAHSREDYPDRDDANWLKHSMAKLEKDRVRIFYRPVDTSVWEPKPRTY
ncbi:MAG: FAD-binding protein [Desulfobacterales bacterium]|nr:FAD-binding protein [Desulfobacterales bacterium]